MRPRVPARVALAVSAALLLFATATRAAPAEDEGTREARVHLGQAKIHFKLREFDLAVNEFKEAYRLKPLGTILFNIAQAERMAGHPRESKFYYEQYLRDVPDAPNRSEVMGFIAELAAAADAAPAAPSPEPVAVNAPPAPVSAPVTAPAPAPTAPAPIVAPLVVKLPEPKAPVSAPLAVAAPAPKVEEPKVEAKAEPAPAKVEPKVEAKAEPLPEKAAPIAAPAPVAPAPKVVTLAPAPTNPPEEPAVKPPPITAPLTLLDDSGSAEVIALNDAPAVSQAKGHSAWPVVALVVAAAAGGVGGYFGWTARQTNDAANAAVFQSDASARADAANAGALKANVLFAAAGVVAIAGLAGVLSW